MPTWIYPQLEKQIPNTVENAEKVLEFYQIYDSLTTFDYTKFITWLKEDLDANRQLMGKDGVIYKNVLSHLCLAEFGNDESERNTNIRARKLFGQICEKFHWEQTFTLDSYYEY